jgi:hypothetical protein
MTFASEHIQTAKGSPVKLGVDDDGIARPDPQGLPVGYSHFGPDRIATARTLAISPDAPLILTKASGLQGRAAVQIDPATAPAGNVIVA